MNLISNINNTKQISSLLVRVCFCTPDGIANCSYEPLISHRDAQCANNHSGLLSALCQPGLSLSLGSSQCISCSKTWYKGYLLILLIAMLDGILLVALLMVFNLTVTVGTLNRLVFYANVIGANSSIFFRDCHLQQNVLISWLILEVGVDMCFFDGMDTYWKTWLQLAFPMYVILLVITMIIFNEHSMKFSRLTARRNPVTTLSYTDLPFVHKVPSNNNCSTIISDSRFANILYKSHTISKKLQKHLLHVHTLLVVAF